MKKFERLYKILMEDVSTPSKKKYTFNEQQFEDAWTKTWNGDEKKQIQNMFKKGAMPVSKIKGIFKDLCKAVADGKNEQAFQIWRKVGTSGYLNRLMWAQGYDCGIPKNFGDKTVKKITFTPHKGEGLFKQSVIKEDVDVDTDDIINYWRYNDVDESKYPDEKLKEFIDEFYIDENGDYKVVDLEDTNDGEYGTPEYAPEFEWDQLVFVYLNPDNTVTVESDEGREDFEDWMEAKNYLIEQMDSTFDNGDDEDQDEDDIEEQSVKPSKKHLIKEDMEPGYWEKVEQYQKDVQEYLNRGDGEEYQGFNGYVDTDDFYITVAEILKQNPDKVKALDDELVSYVESCPGGDSGDSMFGSLGLWCDVIEGNEGYSDGNVFYGLKDPELYTDLGFNVGEELMILLKARFADIARGNSDWDGDDGWADDRAEAELEDMGLTGVVKAINDIHVEYDQDYDDQDQDQDQDQDYDED